MNMKKIMLGLGYLTWIMCNIACIYGFGVGIYKLFQLESIGIILVFLALGLIGLLMTFILSMLCLGLVSAMFGNEKLVEKIDKALPSFMREL